MFRNHKLTEYKEIYRYINRKEDMRRKSQKNKNKKSQIKESYRHYLAKPDKNKYVISSSLRNMLRKSPTRKNKNNYDIILKNAIKLPYSKSSQNKK
jgi:hypothetical protein